MSGVVDQRLGAVVSADELRSPSALSVAWVFAWRAHAVRQVQLHQIGAKGSSWLSHQQQRHALAVASQQAVVVRRASLPHYVVSFIDYSGNILLSKSAVSQCGHSVVSAGVSGASIIPNL